MICYFYKKHVHSILTTSISMKIQISQFYEREDVAEVWQPVA